MKPRPIKLKNAGISILIAVVVGFGLFVMGVTILYLMDRSQQQAFDLEKNSRAFFAVESGIEAAFFHHNARGKGTHFFADGNNDTVRTDTAADAPDSQTIEFDNGSSVKWTVRGRTTDSTNEDVHTGILRENQLVEIPFHWFDEEAVSTEPFSVENITDLNFSLSFSDQEFDQNGNDSSGETFIPGGFDFGNIAQQPVINWALSKIDSGGNLTTFIPRSITDDGALCDTSVGSTTGFYCEQNVQQSISSNANIPGYIVPGRIETTLSGFYNDDDSNNAEFQLSFQPILSFTNSDGSTKIRGIPWALDIANANNGFPREFYEVEVLADSGDVQKNVTNTYLEKTALKGLDSLVLD